MKSESGILAGGSISYLFFTVFDLPRMITFYRDVLGLEMLFFQEGQCAFFRLPRHPFPQIALYSGRKNTITDESHVVLAFNVSRVDQVAEQLRAKGVNLGPIEEVPGGRMVKFPDPEGNILEIHEPE